MASKIMLWPSPRSKYVKDQNQTLIYYSLLVLGVVMIGLNYYMYSTMYAVKLLLMIVVAIILTRETEILFYSHDKDVSRDVAKDLIKKSYPELTAIIYALLIPVGTPLWLVGLGAVLATLLGKLLFGGFAHMVFHSSLVGVLFVTLGWQQLMTGVEFSNAFDNYLLQLIFDNGFFNETIQIGGLYDPSNMVPALSVFFTDPVTEMYPLIDVFLGIVPGVVGSPLVILLIGGFLVYKKAINWFIPVVLLGAFFVTATITGFVIGEGFYFSLYHLLSGSLLFVALFVATDPITTPMPQTGKWIFAIVAGIVAFFIRNAGEYEEGIIFGVLFMNMLTPMLNTVFKEPKKAPVKKPAPKKEGAASE